MRHWIDRLEVHDLGAGHAAWIPAIRAILESPSRDGWQPALDLLQLERGALEQRLAESKYIFLVSEAAHRALHDGDAIIADVAGAYLKTGAEIVAARREGPAILLCPAAIVNSCAAFTHRENPLGYPLKAALLHAVGHHVFPVSRGGRHRYLSEGLAGLFTWGLLAPGEQLCLLHASYTQGPEYAAWRVLVELACRHRHRWPAAATFGAFLAGQVPAGWNRVPLSQDPAPCADPRERPARIYASLFSWRCNSYDGELRVVGDFRFHTVREALDAEAEDRCGLKESLEASLLQSRCPDLEVRAERGTGEFASAAESESLRELTKAAFCRLLADLCGHRPGAGSDAAVWERVLDYDFLGTFPHMVRQAARGAMETLGLAAEQVRGQLAEHLADAHPAVRARAVQATAALGFTGAEVAGRLAERLADEDDAVSVAAVQAVDFLGMREAPQVRELLLNRWDDADSRPTVRRAVKTLGLEEHLRDPLVQRLDGERPMTLWLAAVDIRDLGIEDPRVGEKLVARLADPDPDMREKALAASLHLGIRDPRVREKLVELADDVNPMTRLLTTTAMREFGLREPWVRDKLMARLEDRPRVRQAAVQAIAALGFADEQVCEKLLELVVDFPPGSRAVVRAIRDLGLGDQVRARVVQRLDAADPHVRWHAVMATRILGINNPQVYSKLAERRADVDAAVRAAAEELLTRLGRQH